MLWLDSLQSYLIENLKPYTDYSVSILLYNDNEGEENGPAATVLVKTAEGGE